MNKNDLKNSFLNLTWRLTYGPLMLLIVSIKLSSVYQGYWFTFLSLAALSVLADLGFTTIVLQLSAHRFSNLRINKYGYFYGPSGHIERIASVFRFSISWILKLSILVFPVICFFGFYFLSTKSYDVDWLIPWILYSFLSLIILVTNVVYSFFEGCDGVAKIQKYRFLSSFASVITTIISLIIGLQLYALVLGAFFFCITSWFFIFIEYRFAIYQMRKKNKKLETVEQENILNLLKRYALSFISGYFIFQAFTPIAFHFYGPATAGKVGLSLSIWMAILALANAWVVAVTPRMNIANSLRDYLELDRLFNKSILFSICTYLLAVVAFFLILKYTGDYFNLTKKLLAPKIQFQLAVVFFFQILISGMAIYIRSHMVEPLALMSVLTAIFVTSMTFFVASFCTVDYFFRGMLLSCLFTFPITSYYFLKYKNRGNR